MGSSFCKGPCCRVRTAYSVYLVHIKPSRGKYSKLGCGTRRRSVVFPCSQFNKPHICGVHMEDDTPFRPRLGELPHRRVRANAYDDIVDLAQLVSVPLGFHRSRCTCVHQQQSMKQRTYHHVRWNGCRSPGMLRLGSDCRDSGSKSCLPL